MFAALHLTAPDRGSAEADQTVDRLDGIAADMTPRWERLTPADVVLDISGLRRLFGGPDGVADAARRLAGAHGVSVRVATAEAWSVAVLRASWPDAPLDHVPAAQAQAALASLPVEALGLLPGVGTQVAVPAPGRTTTRRMGGARHYRLSPGLGLVPPHGRAGAPASPSVAAGTPLAAVTIDASAWADLRATLQRWGIRTCGALAALPSADVHARLGASGAWLQQRARGLDPRPLRTHTPADVFEQTLALEWPIDGLEPLSFVLPRLLDPLCAHLEARDRAAAVVRMTLRLTDRQTHVRTIELPAPVRDTRVLRTLLLLDLDAHPPHAGIDVITVGVDPAPGRITQHSLLRKALPSDDDRVALLARLTALMGDGRCGSPALVDSHRPGAVAMQPFQPLDFIASTLDLPGEASPSSFSVHRSAFNVQRSACDVPPSAFNVQRSACDVPPSAFNVQRSAFNAQHSAFSVQHSALHTRATIAAGRAREAAVEPAPEGWIDTAGYHLRRLRRPWPIEVRTAAGGTRPVALRIGVRGWADGTVATASGPWRSSGAWWHSPVAPAQPASVGSGLGSDPGPDPRPDPSEAWDRDEWDVALHDGPTYRVFQDRHTRLWWLDGEID